MNNLGDDYFHLNIDSYHETSLGHGYAYIEGTHCGIFFTDLNNTRAMSREFVGFRALVMTNVITSLLVPNVSDWVRVDVTC